MDNKQTPNELKIKLLWELANVLPPDNHAIKLLRSHYLTVCKKIARREVKLPAAKFAPSVMCPKCCSIWSQSEFSLSLKPQRIRSQKAQRLVETFNKDKANLTKKQRTRAKWLKKVVSSRMETKCGFCQKKSYHDFIKPKKEKEQQQEDVVEVPVKKKKKKKDKTAGLKLDKVKVTNTKSEPSREETKEKIQPQKQLQKQPQKQPKKQHQKQPQKQPQKHPGKGKVTKVVSNTQKQNSLLQLAAMLKNRNAPTTSKGNNQLEKLLR